MSYKLLTINIPTYNRPAKVCDRIMNLFQIARRYPEKLIIRIHNDGGEGSKSISAMIDAANKKIGQEVFEFIDNKVNKKLFEMRYQMAEMTTTKYMLSIDDDDYFDIITLNEIASKLGTNNQPVDWGDSDFIMFGVLTFTVNPRSASTWDKSRVANERSKIFVGNTGNIFNMERLRKNLPLWREALDNLDDHSKMVGDDIFSAYYLLNEGKDMKACTYHLKMKEDIYYALYHHTDDHIFDPWVQSRADNTLKNLNKYRLYVRI